MIKAITKNIQLKIILFSIIVAIITLRDTDCTIDPGLDGPFRWALNYFIAHDKNAFDHLQYTVGPLCILKWPVPMGDHIIISTVFYLIMGILFTYIFTWFYCQYKNTQQIIIPLLACTILILAVNVDILILGCVLLAILYYKFLERRGYLFLALLLTVIGLYLKTSLFISVFFIWVMFSVYLVMEKQFKDLLQIIAFGIILFFFTGLFLFGSIAGVINFAVNNILFALKYSDLLSLYPHNSLIALTVSLSAIAATIIFFRKEPGGFLMNIAVLCLFSAWKYSMGREDFFHAIYFVQLLLLLMILFLLIQRKNIQIGLLLFLTSICFYNFNLQYLPNYQDNYYWFPGVKNFYERVIQQHAFKQKMLENSKQACAINQLPDDWRNTIGTSSVDAFPWDLSIIYINGFSFRSRPCLQSQRLTTENDVADALFFKSKYAPKYIIWHASIGNKSNIDGLDDQYLPNTCPSTMESILTNYSITPMINDRFAVWAKLPIPYTLQKRNIDSLNILWGQWINLPLHDSSSIIKARVDYEHTMMYGLRSFLYKGLPVFIEYETDSGKIFIYNFSKQCSIEGLFLNPLWNDNQLHAAQIKRVRFLNTSPQYFTDRLKVILENVVIVKSGIVK